MKINSCKRGDQIAGFGQIVKTDHGEIRRHTKTRLSEGSQRCHGGLVIMAKNGGRARVAWDGKTATDKGGRRLKIRLKGTNVGCWEKPVIVKRHAALLQAIQHPIEFSACPSELSVRRAQEGKAPMPQRQQMFRGQTAGRRLIGGHPIVPGESPSEERDRQARAEEVADGRQIGILIQRSGNQRVDCGGPEMTQRRNGVMACRIDNRQLRPVAAGANGRLKMVGNTCPIRIGKRPRQKEADFV